MVTRSRFKFSQPEQTGNVLILSSEWGVPVPDMFQKEMAGRRLLAEQDRSTQSGNCAPNASRYVLLVAYSRSGSSLTSDIISRHPDVFAYFEPLHTLARIFRSQQVEFENRTKKHLYLTRMNDYNLLATQVLENQMTCNYGNLSRLALLNPLMTYYYSTKLLYDCVRRSRTPQAEKYCLMAAEERCKQKPIRLMKTVRFSIDQAGVLLKSHPCAKLIFLIKDPRGSFQSKIRMFDFYGKNPVDFNVQRFCWRFQKVCFQDLQVEG
ncbi:hypothetical protein RRG08_012015 [Elysia crispata]|uniref:Sulfotransferase n=1 Tax=Elysia crispata TaxID=231223 RepID=A0AAE0ZXF9_9GAST|nr:hypothetical protein RRG08_012015 [Elysia crispata]